MQTATKTVTETTTGELISTTDIDRAKYLGKRLSLRELLGRRRVVHYRETEEGTLLIFAARELYELKLA